MTTQLKHYQSDAYALPLDTVFYVGTPVSERLDRFVTNAQGDILRTIRQTAPGTCCRFLPLTVSQPAISRFLQLRPDLSPADKNLFVRHLQSSSPSFAPTLAARVPSPDDTFFTILEADLSHVTPDSFLSSLRLFVSRLYSLCTPEPAIEPCCDYAMPDMEPDYNCAPCKKAAPAHKARLVGGKACESAAVSAPAPSPAIDLLLDQLQQRLANLPQTDGINILLQRRFEDFFRTLDTLSPHPLSPLHIDSALRITLPGYNLEIPMLPVWKALYILFLRHPEGIILNLMPDYSGELRRIYLSFAAGEPEQLQNTVNQLTTPGSDIFRQYKSKINNAFRQLLSEDLAQHYIITGTRNAPHKILLPRDQVSLPPSLLNI